MRCEKRCRIEADRGQNRSLRWSWMVLGPACSTSWLWLILPKALLATFVLGASLFRMSNRLANCDSNCRPTRSVTRKVLPADREKVAVPGPRRIPTPQLPKRPMFEAGTENAVTSKYVSVVGLDR